MVRMHTASNSYFVQLFRELWHNDKFLPGINVGILIVIFLIACNSKEPDSTKVTTSVPFTGQKSAIPKNDIGKESIGDSTWSCTSIASINLSSEDKELIEKSCQFINMNENNPGFSELIIYFGHRTLNFEQSTIGIIPSTSTTSKVCPLLGTQFDILTSYAAPTNHSPYPAEENFQLLEHLAADPKTSEIDVRNIFCCIMYYTRLGTVAHEDASEAYKQANSFFIKTEDGKITGISDSYAMQAAISKSKRYLNARDLLQAQCKLYTICLEKLKQHPEDQIASLASKYLVFATYLSSSMKLND